MTNKLTHAAFCALAVLVSACAAEPVASLTAGQSGDIAFITGETLQRPDRAVRRFAAGPPVTLTGDLRLPSTTDRVPAVILLHGCGGVDPSVRNWQSVLNRAGIATFAVDSFGGRGLAGGVCADGVALVGVQRLPEAFAALRLLATHPRIDPERISLMGFSHGGIVVMSAATEEAHARFAATPGPRFAGFFAFYPYCNQRFSGSARIVGPLRVHAAELDAATPPAPCREIVEEARGLGRDASIVVHQGAYHAFDGNAPSPTVQPAADHAGRCFAQTDGLLGRNLFYGPPGCGRRGWTSGASSSAFNAARSAVLEELPKLVAPRSM